jgi:polysaccharide deacetylase 2 family uncharacterized protein YibQ
MFAANVFAKRPVIAAAPASAAAGLRLPASVAKLAAKPWALPAGAAGLLVLSVSLFVLATNDPHAGAPLVKVALDAAGKPGSPLALHPGLPGDPANPTLGSLPPGQDVGMAGAADPLAAQIANGPNTGGQAVITLPQGATLGGGQPAAPPKPKAQPLAQAPITGLTAPGPGGLLPIIGKDGRTPFQAYARPFASNGKPKIAIVVGGLGLNGAATRAAIEKLPPEVTLSFVPYADGLQGWIDMARASGHEVVLELPMEPLDYPANDPGPYTLMTGAPAAETGKRLEWLLSRTTGYFAATNYMGGRFVTSDTAMNALASALKGRGVGLLDDGSAARKGMVGAPRASADSVIDDQLSADAITQQLARLEGLATAHGQALGAGFGYAVTVAQVTRWAAALAGRGYQLAPASAVMRK